MKPALEVKNVSKRFLIQHQNLPYLSFRDKLTTLFKSKLTTEEFWALKDVSFSVHQGDSIGIIGRNGAGKSTLLKILSRITPPTRGKIITQGRIASLLEVGTGFHLELTGRENVFMNGSILGMPRNEIKARFDEIVEFSGTGKFLDTPLKHYSSGMQLRLAFAVAAHLDPEILIVDEVLAVGDAEFQKRCLKKMEAVSSDGRTVLFVSHNLPSLKSICSNGILLKDGELKGQGGIDEIIDLYTSENRMTERIAEGIHYFQKDIEIHEISINGYDTNSVRLEDNGNFVVQIDISFKKRIPFELIMHVKDQEVIVASYANFVNEDVKVFDPGRYQVCYKIETPFLRSGKYKIDLFFEEAFVSWLAVSENIIELEVINVAHHTHLNTQSLKWGAVLMSGTQVIVQ